MGEVISWGDFVVIIFGVMRLSVMIATENGPWDVFVKLRMHVGVIDDGTTIVGTNVLSRGIICVLCNSVWFGMIATLSVLILGSATTMFLLLPFSISAGVLILWGIWSWLEHQL